MTWERFIAEDLPGQLARGTGPRTPLTLRVIAEHYGVSVTPVRKAVSTLVDRGVLHRVSSGRLLINEHVLKHDGHADRKPAQRPVDHFQRISDALVQLSLAGEAMALRESEFAGKFGVSTTIIRQVFSRLAGTGLIVHAPRRGWRLRAFHQSDLQAFLEVRLCLELKALSLARERHTLDRTVIQQMLDANTLGPPPQADNQLHAYFIECSGNPYIADFFERHGPYFRMLFEWEARTAADTEAIEQHREILQAVLDEDWTAVETAMARHILENYPVLKKLP